MLSRDKSVAPHIHALTMLIAGLSLGNDALSGTTGSISRADIVRDVMAEIDMRQQLSQSRSPSQVDGSERGRDARSATGSVTNPGRGYGPPAGKGVGDPGRGYGPPGGRGKGAKGKGDSNKGKGKGWDGKGVDGKGSAKGEGKGNGDSADRKRKSMSEGDSGGGKSSANWLDADNFRLGNNESSLVFHVPTLVHILVTKHGYSQERARQMCFPVGVDFYRELDGKTKACTEPKLHKDRPWAHDFPKGFPNEARSAMRERRDRQ